MVQFGNRLCTLLSSLGSGLPFVDTVDLVDEFRLMDPLAEFITFCLDEVADTWVGTLMVPSAALARERRSGVGPDAAAGVAEAALRRENLFFLFVFGSNHSSVVGPAARVAAGWLRKEEGGLTSLGPSREEEWEILVINGALQASSFSLVVVACNVSAFRRHDEGVRAQ